MSLKIFAEPESPTKRLIKQYEALLEFSLAQCPDAGENCKFCEFLRGMLKRVEALLES